MLADANEAANYFDAEWVLLGSPRMSGLNRSIFIAGFIAGAKAASTGNFLMSPNDETPGE